MTAPKPTIVMVPGAWHTPEFLESFTPLLHNAGYTTVPIKLASVDVSPPVPDFTADVAAIREVVTGLVDQGQDVVLVLHSYAGVAGTEALRGLDKAEREKEGKKGAVVKLVYLASLVPSQGESVAVIYQDELLTRSDLEHKTAPPEGLAVHEDGTMTVKDAELRFYNDLSPEQAQKYAKMLKTQSPGVFASELTYEAYRHIPSIYLVTSNDKSVHPLLQEKMAKKAGIETVTIDTSHSPFLSKPEELLKFIRKAAGEAL